MCIYIVRGDKALIKSIKKGQNDHVLNQLYERILPKVKKYILSKGGSLDDVKDSFQDAILTTIKKVKLGEFDESNSLEGFVFVVAKNNWLNKIRYNNKHQEIDTLSNENFSNSNHLESLIDTEKQSAIRRLIDELKEPCNKILRLTIYLEMSLQELTEEMNYSSSHVAKIYKYRCKKKLMEIIKRDTVFKCLINS